MRRSAAVSIASAGAASFGGAGASSFGASVATGAPQLKQKRAPPTSSVPHVPQSNSNARPQPAQNLALGGLAKPQVVQFNKGVQ